MGNVESKAKMIVSKITENQNFTGFYRFIGVDNNSNSNVYFSSLTNLLMPLSNMDVVQYSMKIPLQTDIKISNSVLQNCEMIRTESDIAPVVNDIIEKYVFDKSPKVASSLNKVVSLYLKNENVSINVFSNFFAKLILWANSFAKTVTGYDKKCVLYYGPAKKHELYFLIFLTFVENTVLQFCAQSDTTYGVIDKNNTYSQTECGASFIDIRPSEYSSFWIDFAKYKKNARFETIKQCANVCVKKDIVKFPEDFFIPLEQRVGYVNGTKKVIPYYFVRIIGVESAYEAKLDMYAHSVYMLCDRLKSKQNTIIFHDDIPNVNISETEKHKSIQDRKTGTDIAYYVMEFINSLLISDAIKGAIITSFETLFISIFSDSSNIGVVSNFGVKLCVWLSRYAKILFNNDNTVPCVMYYGKIKKHECLFLHLLANSGCDVLYMSSNKAFDNIFEEIDKNGGLSSSIVLKEDADVPFPENDVSTVSAETVAFRAEREVEKEIYNTQTGIFKPWQFETYCTQAVRLETTYDELKILWDAEARMRPGFNISSDTVYIPSIFAKINGIHDNLADYETDIKKLQISKNTAFYNNIHVFETEINRQTLFSLTYCFDKNGCLDKNAVISNPIYNYQYLRTSLQNLIFHKAKQLIDSNILQHVDSKTAVEILYVLLNIPEEILTLIQQFDFPYGIPKLVVFWNQKESFSVEDCILFAFCNSIGMDVCIFSPSGFNNIENILRTEIYTTHQLKNFDVAYQYSNIVRHSSVFSKLFGSH